MPRGEVLVHGGRGISRGDPVRICFGDDICASPDEQPRGDNRPFPEGIKLCTFDSRGPTGRAGAVDLDEVV